MRLERDGRRVAAALVGDGEIAPSVLGHGQFARRAKFANDLLDALFVQRRGRRGQDVFGDGEESFLVHGFL